MNKLIILIEGYPLQGKSYLADKLHSFYDNSEIIRTDDVLKYFFLKYHPDIWTNNIYNMFSGGLPENVMQEVKKLLTELIEKSDNCVIIVDGYVLKYFQFDFKNQVRIEASHYNYIINGKELHLSQVFYEIRSIILNGIKSNYQTFYDLKLFGGSDSSNKFEKLKIDWLLKDKTILDIGCNNGYFCFKAVNHMRWQNAKKAIGIDINAESIDTADVLKNCIYQHKNTEFKRVDFFDYMPSEPIDVVFCLSTFHYFREKQQEFFHKCYSILSDGGLLVLEAGISEERENEIFTEQYQRGVDSVPCFYPNEFSLINMAYGFDLTYKGESVDQPGDKIKRNVYHFKKKI
jgi:SAM-dependent methyltransferase